MLPHPLAPSDDTGLLGNILDGKIYQTLTDSCELNALTDETCAYKIDTYRLIAQNIFNIPNIYLYIEIPMKSSTANIPQTEADGGKVIQCLKDLPVPHGC